MPDESDVNEAGRLWRISSEGLKAEKTRLESELGKTLGFDERSKIKSAIGRINASISLRRETVALNEPEDRKAAENIKALEKMFARARAEDLWFWTSYQDLWFHPDELERLQTEERRFCWGPANWELRDPMEQVAEIDAMIAKKLEEKARTLDAIREDREAEETRIVQHDYRCGFTLVELMVVLLIVSIISAVALPSVVSALRHRQVSEASRLIYGAIAGARDEAINANRPSGIRLVADPQFSGIGPATITTYDASGNPTVVPNPYVGVLDPNQIFACNRIVPLVAAPGYSEGMVSAYPRFAYANSITNGLPCLILEQSLLSPDGLPNSPTSWYWNIRVGDKVQVNNAGPRYTVVGPVVTPNPEGFVNLGNPGPNPPLPTGGPTIAYGGIPSLVVYPDYLMLVNGGDDNANGWTDEGFDGVDNDGNGVIDEAAEWEAESWRGSPGSNAAVNVPYSIDRRPVPGPASRSVSLPSGVVIDLTTWGTTLERSRVGPFMNASSGYVDIMVYPDGTISPSSPYSSPSSFGMGSIFVHLWLSDRADLYPPSVSNVPSLPVGVIGQSASATPYPGPRISGDYAIVTIFSRGGKVAVSDNPTFDDPSGPINGVYNQGWPFLPNQKGADR